MTARASARRQTEIGESADAEQDGEHGNQQDPATGANAGSLELGYGVRGWSLAPGWRAAPPDAHLVQEQACHQRTDPDQTGASEPSTSEPFLSRVVKCPVPAIEQYA